MSKLFTLVVAGLMVLGVAAPHSFGNPPSGTMRPAAPHVVTTTHRPMSFPSAPSQPGLRPGGYGRPVYGPVRSYGVYFRTCPDQPWAGYIVSGQAAAQTYANQLRNLGYEVFVR